MFQRIGLAAESISHPVYVSAISKLGISMGRDIMANSRKEHLSKFSDRYKLINGERSENNLYWLCIYCGEPATCRDHVPPITRVCDYESYGLKKEYYLLAPSCQSCNSILASSLQETILARIEYVKDKLKSKFKKHLDSYEWSEEEISELGKNLRSKIVTENKRSQLARRRVEYYGGFDVLLDELDNY